MHGFQRQYFLSCVPRNASSVRGLKKKKVPVLINALGDILKAGKSPAVEKPV